MNVPDEPIETDWAEAGCSKRSCRYGHSNTWGLCAHAEEPPPDTRCFRWKTVTASDRDLSIVTEEVDHAELRAEIERQVRAKVAEEIEAVRRPIHGSAMPDVADAAYDHAARIARGES